MTGIVRAAYRYVLHKITEHPDTEVTFEAECLWCDWKSTPATDPEPVDVECISHTGGADTSRSGGCVRRSLWSSGRTGKPEFGADARPGVLCMESSRECPCIEPRL
ncbi:DUF7848 domain-containing protein [Streptomyces sp. NBC_00464]|uniref:DUF7848 domain-containing protein n=1 Tax=Streptomyces sp. NBC_00464 TaxID=2975751 RepID=UPI003FA69BE2